MPKSIKTPTEDSESKALMKWAKLHPSQWVRQFLFHIPNGGKRNLREAIKLQQMGVKPGVSDYFMPLPNGSHAGLWIELKRKGEKPTPSNNKKWKRQIDWLKAMNKLGYWGEMCFGWEDASRTIDRYLNYNIKNKEKNNGPL